MIVIAVVSALALLFIIIGLAEPLASRLRLPFSVVLAIFGTVLGVGAVLVQQSSLAGRMDPEMLALFSLPIRSSVFLYVFLPTLVFQVALELNLRRMLEDLVPILVMAVVAVVVATFFVGYFLQPVSTMPLIACLLLGAIVSTTDPSAVVGIFRDVAAPQRLTRIVEGESLLNDAAAIALFGFFLTFVMMGVPNPTLRDALVGFPTLVFGGALIGYVAGRIGVAVMSSFPNHPSAQISLSIALPYTLYIISEQALGVSGIIAVVMAGMTVNWYGPGRLSPTLWTWLREIWNILAHWAGALIFIMAALLIPRLMAEAELRHIGLIAIVVIAATVARIVMLWGMLPLLHKIGFSPKVERPYRVAILWGGLRGAITLTLALAVTENLRVPAEVRTEIGIIGTGFALVTLFLQGSTLRWVVRKLGLTKLAPLDRALSHQVIALALQNVREDVAETVREYGIEHEIVRSEAKRFGDRLNSAVSRAEEAEDIPERDRITLGLVALAGRERDGILAAFRQQIVPAIAAEQLINNADRLIERARTGGRTGYRNAARKALGYNRSHRLAIWAHNRLRLSGSLSQMTASRFELLLGQRLILTELHPYIDTKIRRIHGRRIAELLHELLRRREEEVNSALDGMRLQYPGYVEEIERRYVRRTALRLEENEYELLRDDGLIGPELHQNLREELARKRGALKQRPTLDLTVQKAALVQKFPLFASLAEEERARLAKSLKTIYVHPGEMIIRRGDPARSVYFIASGAVEVEAAGQNYRLGRGQMFGQLAIMAKRRRSSQIKAISPSTLLALDETGFRRLLKRSPDLRAAYDASIKNRTRSPSTEVAGAAPDVSSPPEPDIPLKAAQ